MVLKRSKFGANTGNTLRAKHKKGSNEQSITAAVICKSAIIRGTRNVERIRDSGLNTIRQCLNPIRYPELLKLSLNKDKRWLLPEYLNQKVEYSDGFNKAESCIEQKIKCRRYSNNQPQDTDKKVWIILFHRTGESMFHNGQLFRTNCMRIFLDPEFKEIKKTSKQWRETSLEKSYDAYKEADAIHVWNHSIKTKLWPCADGTSLNRSVFDIGDRSVEMYTENVKEQSVFAISKDPWDTRQRRKKKGLKYFHRHDFEDAYDEDSDDINEDEYVEPTERSKITLGMFMPDFKSDEFEDFVFCDDASFEDFDFCDDAIPPATSIEPVNSASGQCIKKFPKRSYVTIDTPCSILPEISYSVNNDTEDVGKILVQGGKKTNEYVCTIKVKNSQLTAEHLTKAFGTSYKEGGTLPRVFAIFNKTRKLNSVIVLIKDVQEIDDQDCSITMKFLNVAEGTKMMLNRLLQSDENAFDLDYIVQSVWEKSFTVVLQKRCNQLKANTVIDEKFKVKKNVIELTDIWNDVLLHQETKEVYYAFESCPICSVCLTTDDLVRLECGHYVCSVCLNTYLTTQILAGYCHLVCPEIECICNIDIVTILTYVEFHVFRKYARNSCASYVEKTTTIKRCINRNCRKIAVSNISGVEERPEIVIVNHHVVSCDCQITWCFECQQKDHWPSTCEANKNYLEQQKRDADDFFTSANWFKKEIKFKMCPSCGNAIEKYGGCNNMHCICGKRFCWSCLGDLEHSVCLNVVYNAIPITSFIYDVDPHTVRVQRKAAEFDLMMTRVMALKEVILNREIYTFDFVEPDSMYVMVTAKKAFELLMQCIKVMQNLTIARAFTTEKIINKQTVVFVKKLYFLCRVLKHCLHVRSIDQLQVNKVIKNMDKIENVLGDLCMFGLKTK